MAVAVLMRLLLAANLSFYARALPLRVYEDTHHAIMLARAEVAEPSADALETLPLLLDPKMCRMTESVA